MPRIRTIKPEFWADEKLGPMDTVTRLVFLGLISMADDAGRLVDNTKQIDAFLFPYTSDTCRRSLDDLSAKGRICRGMTRSGQAVIQVVNWHHQKIDKPNTKAILPPIDDTSTINRRHVDDTSALLSVPVSTTNDLLPTTNDLTTSAQTASAEPHTQRAVPLDDPLFTQFWEAYPRRAGGNSRQAAARAWAARVRAGVQPLEILAGLARYGEYCRVTGKVGTEYVQQASTFLGRGEGWRDLWALPDPAVGNGRPVDKITEGRQHLVEWINRAQGQELAHGEP